MLIAFNKPFQVLCQFSPADNKRTLKHYLDIPNIYPAGRLDYDSEGLLLLTDNGRLQARIADPQHKLPKTYWVQVEGIITAVALQQLANGVMLNDGLTRLAQAEPMPEPPGLWPRDPPVRQRANIPTSWLALTLSEGKNRQVRRMTAATGFPTLRLIRYAIGDYTVDGLLPAQWLAVTPPRF